MNYSIQIIPHRDFTKDLRKQTAKVKDRAKDRLYIFCHNPFNPILYNHALTGRWKGHRSINITGDIRAIYKQIDETAVVFVALGSHSELYR
ncbi:hypothetical protein COS66_03750 [Candidatus Berkelbacteria bacterium CG06_land_8_20_14_3_00_43_10]|uniref:Type II toxin-antitoxin system mRNA interferase toxin, RelE/StbE family n=1 Tax=Candidatus Berkelbacteria bacterium CG10_big_fil_rev_8_21_14_0_10_43_14 TaxID=1974515 RepID=A0A2M6R9B7_9BACT|nr:MAG: hypothetical protein COT79_01145 [Candidatus Berkelbacteria bacterium CG10_big_fil_rev_8_21_14_0_10_43_14]PIU86913.1 MAG: hypothetical protein COS66_03750 [Candidatus Berkelbacteria bacterium CG06_land_8_20_14_3_00_43_10]